MAGDEQAVFGFVVIVELRAQLEEAQRAAQEQVGTLVAKNQQLQQRVNELEMLLELGDVDVPETVPPAPVE